MESANSLSVASSNRVRGWNGLAAIESTASSVTPAWGFGGSPSVATLAVAPEMSASSPRPSTFLVMAEDLPCQLPVAFGAGAVRVIEHDGFPERGGFAEPDIARDDCLVNPVSKELTSFVRDLSREAEAGVEHGEQHALDAQRRVQVVLDQPDGGDELGEPLERQVLAL